MPQYEVTFHKHSCFQIEDAQCVFLFDWFDEQLPVLDGRKMIYILNSHKHADHYNASLLQLADQYERIQFVFSREIKMPKEDARFLPVKRNGSYELAGPVPLHLETLPSTDIGVAFLLQYGRQVFYHAGDLNWWSWSGESYSWNRNMEARFQQIMQRLEGMAIDLAFVPLDPRLEERFSWGFDYFLQHTQASYVFPMHLWGQLDTIARWKELPQNSKYQQCVQDIQWQGQKFMIQL